MNNDIFELSMRLGDINRSLTQIATLMVLEQRLKAGMISPNDYMNMLNIITERLIPGSTETRESQSL